MVTALWVSHRLGPHHQGAGGGGGTIYTIIPDRIIHEKKRMEIRPTDLIIRVLCLHHCENDALGLRYTSN